MKLYRPAMRYVRIGSFALWAASLIGSSFAENWPSWRGPRGTGVSLEQHLPLRWSDKENVAWRTALPDRGNSTPIVSGERVFLTQAIEKDNRRTVMCLDRASGNVLWQSGVTYTQQESTNGRNPYCSSSPVTDGNRVVAYFGSAGVRCYDMDGKELWHKDLGQVNSWHGSGSSPVLYRELCFVNAGPGSNAALVALNKNTGEVAWKIAAPQTGFGDDEESGPPADQGPQRDGFGRRGNRGGFGPGLDGPGGFGGGITGSWSTPLIAHNADRDDLLVVFGGRFVGLEPETGKEIWHCDGMPPQVIGSPTISNGIVIATGKMMFGGTRVMAVRLGGKGDVTKSNLLWQRQLAKDCIGSPVTDGKHVFLVTQFGSVVCLDLTSGKKLAEKRLTGHGSVSGSWSSPVLADGKLWLPNQSGEVFVLEASPDLTVLAANFPKEQTTCSSLALADGRVFLRTYEALWCFQRNAPGAK